MAADHLKNADHDATSDTNDKVFEASSWLEPLPKSGQWGRGEGCRKRGVDRAAGEDRGEDKLHLCMVQGGVASPTCCAAQLC